MLTRLSISNYALISSLDIEFPDGLIIITGETGAGKSILLGAISLLLGKRADMTVFGDASRNCVVEAEFSDRTGKTHILRRVLNPSGRSRSFLDDEPVPLSELAALSNTIIDIHEQHQHLLLSDSDFRLSVLDHFAGLTAQVEDYRKKYTEYRRLCGEISETESAIAQAERDAEYHQFRLSRLQEAGLKAGELEQLEEEQKTLSHAEEIRTALDSALAALDSEGLSVLGNLRSTASYLLKCRDFNPALEVLADRLESCRIELRDIQEEIERMQTAVVVSPDRLEIVEDRLSLLYSLLRKYDCADTDSLIALQDSLLQKVESNETMQDKLENLRKEENRMRSELVAQSKKLSKERHKAAVPLSESLQTAIRSLEMPHAVFQTQLTDLDEPGPSGINQLDFAFSANGGERLQDIAKVASGGELSRVMLSLKGVLARYTSLPTMIFDEIDTGVSGRAADKMGEMIGRMGENMQIFAITHLPQIASKKGTHYLVYKEFDSQGRPQTGIRRLDGEDRVREVARMLSGSELTPEAEQNARVLLEKGMHIQ